jgi:hypothetical protein
MNNGNWESDPEEDLRKLIAKHKAMDSEDSKNKDRVKNTWINLKSVFYTSLTLIAVIASLALLPLAIILVAGFVLFVFYKLMFTDSNNVN